MSRLPFFVLLGTLLAGCATEPPQQAFALSNLQYGTMCGEPMRVCEQTTDIVIDGKARCIYDNREVPCSWYGFSFDYVPKEGKVTISCDVKSDRKHDVGNPQGVVAKDTHEHRFDIELSAGRFVNPQYAWSHQFGGVEHLTETCFYQDRKLFEFTLNLHFVANPS